MVTSSTTEYSVRQTGHGGQVLDQPAGLPHVEIFSVDPLQQAPAATPPALTVHCYRLAYLLTYLLTYLRVMGSL